MQWNCPHCGTYLAVAEDVIGTGWSFSKCYQCGGAALIRKAETNVIKVDRVPANERVILPEAAPSPARGLLSENATRRLEQHLKLPPNHINRNAGVPNPSPTYTIGAQEKSQPNPATPQPHPHPSAWEKPTLTDPRPNLGAPQTRRPGHFIKTGTLSAGVIAILSGFFLLNQAQTLIEKTQGHSAPRLAQHHSSLPPEDSSVLTDQVEDRAMAPLPQSQAPLDAPPIPTAVSHGFEKVREAIEEMRAAPPQPLAQATGTPPTAPLPENRVQAEHAKAAPALFLKIHSTGARFRSGPGEEYPVVGAGSPGQRFAIRSSLFREKHLWYKLASIKPGIEPGEVSQIGAAVGWVRNDLVESVSE